MEIWSKNGNHNSRSHRPGIRRPYRRMQGGPERLYLTLGILASHNGMAASWLGIWAACLSNIVGRDPQHSRGDSSVPIPQAVVGGSKKKVYVVNRGGDSS